MEKHKVFKLKESWDISTCDDTTFLIYYLKGKGEQGECRFSPNGKTVWITYQEKERKPYNRTLTNKIW